MEENFLYGLDNEQENVFLPAVDFENVIITDKVDTVTVEKADGSTEVNIHRFVSPHARESGIEVILVCGIRNPRLCNPELTGTGGSVG